MKTRTRVVARHDVQRFLNNVEELQYWTLSSFDNQSSEVGVDGARWILEAVKKGNYHVVDRWSPQRGPIRILGLAMLLDLAQLKLLYQEVY